jgi:hypothetical protein
MTSAAHHAPRIHHRVRNFLLYALLCVLIAFAFIGITFVVEDRWGHDAFIRWGGLTGFSLGLFALFVGDSQKFLRKWRFWAVTAILLAVHLTAFAIILTHVREWKLTWFVVMVVEYPAFLFLRDAFASPR